MRAVNSPICVLMLYNETVKKESISLNNIEEVKHIEQIKKILDINAGPVTERVVDAIIKAMLKGDVERAQSLLQQKIEVDAKTSETKFSTKIPENIVPQIIPTIEEYLTEQGITFKKKIPVVTPKESTVSTLDTKEAEPQKIILQEPKNNIQKESTVSLDVPVIEEENRELLEKFESIIDELAIKKWNSRTSDEEKIEELRTLFEDLSIPISFIEPIYTEEEIIQQQKDKEKAKKVFEEREKTIQEIGEILKQGIDKVVIHGQTKETEDSVTPEAKWGAALDVDTRGALYFLGLAKNINYNEGATMQLTTKGSKTKNEKNETVLYLDTSGEQLSFRLGDNGKEVFIDHHQQYFNSYATSATELMREVLTKNGLIETEPWMGEMSDFITDVDNLLYVNYEGYTEKFLAHQWPKSLYALYKTVPFEKILEWFRAGKDPADPQFSEEELAEQVSRTLWNEKSDGSLIATEEKVSLREIIEEQKQIIGADISNAKFAIELMKKRGLATENSKLGKLIYNKQDRQPEIGTLDKKRNKVNKIYNGFLAARALGYDSYATYNEKYKRFMVNTQTYNLQKLLAVFKKAGQDAVLVRGVMLLQPQGTAKGSKMTEDKFLELLGAK